MISHFLSFPLSLSLAPLSLSLSLSLFQVPSLSLSPVVVLSLSLLYHRKEKSKVERCFQTRHQSSKIRRGTVETEGERSVEMKEELM